MLRNLLACVAATALMTGAAFAQDSSNSTYYSRTITQTSPFGTSRATTITTSRSRTPDADEVGDADDMPPPMAAAPPYDPSPYAEQSADLGDEPPPRSVGPRSVETTTTRRVDPDGLETHTYQRRQTFTDRDQELGARTTTQTQTHTTSYGPPVVYAPTQAAPGPAPVMELPPHQYSTTTTTVTHDGE